MIDLPASLDDITSAWLGLALAVTHPGTTVADVEQISIIHGSLTKVAISVEFSENPGDLPSAMYVKGAFEGHGLPVSVRSEAVFYDVAQPVVSVATPAPFAAIHDDAHGIVVMEDLGASGATITDPRVGWSPALVEDGLRQLASLHAGWWGDGRVEGMPQFEGSNALGAILMAEGYWETCVDGPTGVHVPAEFRDRVRTRPLIEELWRLDAEPPLAFCHGDAHLGNTFVTADGGAGFLDWGGVTAGHWAREVCYFMAGALAPADRQAHEERLLQVYLEALASHGVADPPSYDAAWLSYRRHILHGLLWFLCPTQMQPVEIINANVERFAVAASDHGIQALF
ncbi:MAG: aminoglycoside phosphotransferase family protein [Acidimicrobiales bacterium]|nr:aminoglycoside phosphotransferase family protein [Acidimicrobiales bacterium]